ncbi:SDR family oxidoreductase [Propioniciclava soli]|uniref:SDR family oxidoreductase n=1 Tax=Propioniciclava soli TaxID=2775081 RepID=A0ABZ3CCR5_9ACTN
MSALPFTMPQPLPFDQLLSLEGRTAIVTGGSRGIGEAIVRRLAEAGATVVFTARHADALRAVEETTADLPGTCVGVVADIGNLDDSRQLVATTRERFGGVDILINNAATFPPGTALEADEELWDRLLDTDTKGAFFLAQYAAADMVERGRGGRIINLLSTAFVNATPMFAVYSIAKAGLWAATRVLAQELAPHRITVNALTPGSTMTQERLAAFASGDLSKVLGNDLPVHLPEAAAQAIESGQFGALIKQMVPMGRPGFPDDLARAALFLACDLAEYITGQNIVVDGGQSASVKTGPSAAMPTTQSAPTAESAPPTATRSPER